MEHCIELVPSACGLSLFERSEAVTFQNCIVRLTGGSKYPHGFADHSNRTHTHRHTDKCNHLGTIWDSDRPTGT